MTYQEIDLATWKRKAQYDFFKTFDQPFFNVTANIDVTALHRFSKKEQIPFFYATLHAILKTVNGLPEFCLRMEGEAVLKYEQIHAGVTILLEDETFLYCTIEYREDVVEFYQAAQQSVAEHKASGAFLPHGRNDVIYVSTLPWISFTGLQHARNSNHKDSIPRFVIGKYFEDGARLQMPVSVEVHHALVDGFHVGQFFKNIDLNIQSLKD